MVNPSMGVSGLQIRKKFNMTIYWIFSLDYTWIIVVSLNNIYFSLTCFRKKKMNCTKSKDILKNYFMS